MATNEQSPEIQIVDASQMDTDGNNVHTGNRFSCRTPMAARYVYAAIFLLATIVAWVLRENPITYFMQQRHSGCQGHRGCLAAEGVLIISLTFFLFFSVMFFSTVGTRTVQDRRNSWHFEWWFMKALLWLVCLGISVIIPSDWIQLYGKAARFGAGVFLVIQLISLIGFITRLKYKWCQTNIENQYNYIKVIALSVLAYSTSIVLITLMFYWYKGSMLNTILIVITLCLVCLLPLISLLLSKSRGFYMEPGLMGAYIAVLCWSAIKSEPDTGSGADNLKTIIFFIFGLMAITYATFSTGSDGIRSRNVVGTENESRNEVGMENNVPYGYGCFHLVFALGSVYFGMLLVGWNTYHTSEKWSMDVGWTGTWVHLANEVVAFISFVAIVIARRYEIDWLRQLVAKCFGIGVLQQENNNDAHQTELDIVPPEGSRATDPERSETDNGPPPDPRGTELERSQMDDNEPPLRSSSTLGELFRVPLSPLSLVESSDSDEIVDWE